MYIKIGFRYFGSPCSALFMTFVHLSSDESESKRFISLFRSSVSPQPPGNKNQRTVGKINQQLYLIALHRLLLSRLLSLPSPVRLQTKNGEWTVLFGHFATLSESILKLTKGWNCVSIGRWLALGESFADPAAINIHHIRSEHMGIKSSAYFITYVSKMRIFRSSSTLINCWCHFNQRNIKQNLRSWK